MRLMGRGGMGAVYEAIHLDLKKRVAIKTLHPTVAALPEARARFLREGEAAARIRHPNVVDVTDVSAEGGIAYLVMEFLEGEDLAAFIHRCGALPVAQSVDLMLPVIGAIAAAHEEGVIHRDLKPENVFMTRTRHGGFRPTVLDFGISKLTVRGGSTLALTGTGATMGTPYYVAPEQIRSASSVDARTDQYALGAILYECVTGHRAHQGDSLYEVIRTVGEGTFTPPSAHRPDIPPGLEQAILRAMRLEPEHRFPSVQALGRAIMPFASPAVRDQWTKDLTGEGDIDARQRSVEGWPGAQSGGTVILPTPAPGAKSRAASAPSGKSPPSITTLGASAAQIALPVQRPSRLQIGGVAALALVGVGVYLLTTPKSRPAISSGTSAAVSRAENVPLQVAPRPAERYRVSVTASPGSASFDLDGRWVGTGRVFEELTVDGVEHTLTVTAAGFLPAKVLFRDHSPPGGVTLEPVPGSANRGTEPGPPKAQSQSMTQSHREGGHRKPHPRPGTEPVDSVRANNAAIIE